jgi:hypothetical protein
MSLIAGAPQEDACDKGKGVTRSLARHAATLRYEALPPALVSVMHYKPLLLLVLASLA